MMLNYLQTVKDVRFFISLSGLMCKCSVLNLEMFERQIKAEGLGMGAELAAGEHQNLNDADFTCSLFRFLQLTCEGHNLDFQNYLVIIFLNNFQKIFFKENPIWTYYKC